MSVSETVTVLVQLGIGTTVGQSWRIFIILGSIVLGGILGSIVLRRSVTVSPTDNHARQYTQDVSIRSLVQDILKGSISNPVFSVTLKITTVFSLGRPLQIIEALFVPGFVRFFPEMTQTNLAFAVLSDLFHP